MMKAGAVAAMINMCFCTMSSLEGITVIRPLNCSGYVLYYVNKKQFPQTGVFGYSDS